MKKLTFLVALMCANVMAFAAPTTAAPVPTWPAAQVLAVYSDSYTLPVNWGYLENWNQTTTLTTEEIEGNHYLSYANFNYLGWGCAATLNCLTMEKLHLDIWADAAGEVSVFPIFGGGGNATDDSHSKKLTLAANQWNSFDLDLATDFAGLNLSSIFQFKFADGTINSFAVDNVFFYRTAPLDDTEAPTNFTATLTSTTFFSATISVSAEDNMGVVNYSVLLKDAEVATYGGTSGVAGTINIPNLEPGTAYTFSVVAKDGNNNAAAPIEVSTTTLALPAAAPAPTVAAENVKSIYSNVYEPATTVSDYCQWWWASPALRQVVLGEDNALFYDNLSNEGSFGFAFNPLDAAGFQKLHLSIYPLQAGTIDIWPIIPPEDNFHQITPTLTAGQWNEIVLDYTSQTFANFGQIGFRAFGTLGAFFLDNVYFFKDVTAIDNVNAGQNVQKVVENGQLIIIKNGVRYNAAGQEVR